MIFSTSNITHDFIFLRRLFFFSSLPESTERERALVMSWVMKELVTSY